MIDIFTKLKKLSAQDFIKGFMIFSILACLCSFLLFPLITLFLKAFQSPNGDFVLFNQFITYFTSPNMLSSLTNTIYISTMSTIISVSLAFFFAYAISRKHIPFKKPLQFIAMLPLFSPTMLLGISLIYLFGNQGLFTKLGFVIPLYGEVGIIIAESIFCFPVALMVLVVAFSAADNRLYEAADAMGTTPFRKLLTITLPNVKYGLISSVFICFTYSFTDFGAPSVVGGSYNVLATDIYKQVIGQQNFNMGAVVGIIMMIPAVASFFVDRFVTSKQSGSISSKAVPYVIKKSKLSDNLSFGFCTTICLLMIGFFAMSLYASLVNIWPYNMSLTLKHYDFTKVAAGSASTAIQNSIIVSIFTAVIGTTVAFLTAYIMEKVHILPKVKRVVYFLTIAPMAIPGTVVGLSYILFYNARSFAIPFTNYSIVNGFNPLYGSMAILVIVNIIHYFSVPFITASTALKRLDGEFETVSDSLRVPFYCTLFKITIPMSVGAILEMVVYFFVNSMITVSAVVFLYTPVFKLASVAILNMRDAGDIAEAAAMSMII
ncbi:MAG: putative 2-aminoethylphosphonate ABC transporter permease subunit, partial [Oscillospiraceae bacterium]